MREIASPRIWVQSGCLQSRSSQCSYRPLLSCSCTSRCSFRTAAYSGVMSNGSDGFQLKIPFLEVPFWLDYLFGAVDIAINLLVSLLLFIVFYTIVSCAIRCTKVVTKRMDKDVVPFIISSLKAVLWVQIIPIVIGNIGIDTKSMLAVISAVALSVGIALKPLVENCELARRRFERLLLLAAAAAAAAGVVAH